MKQLLNILTGTFLLFLNNAYGQQVTDPTTNVPQAIGSNIPLTSYPGIYNMSTTESKNEVKTWIPDVPTQQYVPTGLYSRQQMDYYDGLGRPFQTISRKADGLGNDIIQHHIYDALGLESRQYLPFTIPTASNSGNFCNTIYDRALATYPLTNGEQPYSQAQYDNSPLNRIVKQMSPGASWVGSDRGVEYSYKTNRKVLYSSGGINPSTYLIVGDYPRFTIGSGNTDLPQYQGNYEEGSLYVNEMKDEDGKIVQEVKDKTGLLLMKKVSTSPAPNPSIISTQMFPEKFAYTIYVYDEYRRLRVVLPPAAIKPIVAGVTNSGNNFTYNYTWTSINADIIAGLCYTYFYDNLNRLTEKKIPGKNVEYYVYDKRNRLIFTQDGNLRAQSKWNVTFYDALDRPTMSGLLTSGLNREQMGSQVLDNSTWTTSDCLYYIKNYDLIRVYPASLNQTQILSYTYYDDYTQLLNLPFDASQFNNINLPSNGTITTSILSNRTRGLTTGSKLRVIDNNNPNSNTWISSANFYDEKGRVIQTQTQNINGGIDISSNIYYFQGMLYKNIVRHQNPAALAIPGSTDAPLTTLKITSTYNIGIGIDGGNEMLSSQTKKINDGSEYAFANYKYDFMGRNTQKKFPIGIQTQEYNIKGLLTHINVDNSTISPYNLMPIFDEKLYYDKGFSSKLYNGNIAGIVWSGSYGLNKAYGYSYDNLNRLTHAEFSNKVGSNWNQWADDYTVSNITYDLNGNLLSMNQKVPANNTTILMDQLSYTYAPNSNQLIKVEDAVPAQTTTDLELPDFKNNANIPLEYTYDNNGNMITDANKKITSISYNHLNKPDKIIVDGGDITYTYDASGNRLKKIVNNTDPGKPDEIWTYFGNFVYKNNVMQYIINDEGRIRPTVEVDVNNPGSIATRFAYDYFVKDHLGNVRSTVTDKPDNVTYLATHEFAAANVEEMVFDNIENLREANPLPCNSNCEVIRLNGGVGQERSVGTALMLKVNAGDKFKINVDAYYAGVFSSGNTTGANTLVDALAGVLIGNNATVSGIGELSNKTAIVQSTLSNPAVAQEIESLGNFNNDAYPGAHLNFIYFKEDLSLDHILRKQIENGLDAWQNNDFSGVGNVGNDNIIKIDQPGYIMVFVDNQADQDVWFDNLRVNKLSNGILEEDHYYPFGLTLNTTPITSIPNGVKQPYKLTTKELESKFDLNMYDFGARQFDMQRGQWTAIDPLSEKNFYESPYCYVGNNPIRFVDFDGRLKFDKNGNIISENVGQPVQVHHLSGSTAIVQPVTVYADDGTKIEAFKNISGDAGWNTNCHGTTFAKGQVWINNDQVGKILKGDNYKKETESEAKKGDVLVYNLDKPNKGDADHSVTVTENKNGQVTVYGQGGLEVENHSDNANQAWPGGTQSYYHKGTTQGTQAEQTKNNSVTPSIPAIAPAPLPLIQSDNLRVGSGSNSAG